MKYFLIAGEASGDIHGAELIGSLRSRDADAEIRFFGGDKMARASGHAPEVHCSEMAYMGFVEVARHLGKIMGFMKKAKTVVSQMRPDAVVLIDYPSFNLKVAKYAHSLGVPVFYFISPKVWAWKQWRVRDIKRYVTELYSILPFETEFFARHDYRVSYVGNPTVQEVLKAREGFTDAGHFFDLKGLDSRPKIVLVPGSRVKEIRDNLPSMITAAMRHQNYQAVIAGAPGIDEALYSEMMSSVITSHVPVLRDCTFQLVSHARVALVTSGTATLETALLGTPQVVCYRMNGKKWLYKMYSMLIKGKYVSLPNLIADKTVVPELLLHGCTADTIDAHLERLIEDSDERRAQLEGYRLMSARLGTQVCTDTAAALLLKRIGKCKD